MTIEMEAGASQTQSSMNASIVHQLFSLILSSILEVVE
jgi:hypothetical protein